MLTLIGSGDLVTALASLIVSFGHSGDRVVHAGRLLLALFMIWLASRTRVAESHAVGELQIHDADWLTGRTLAALELRAEHVNVLGVIRGDQYASLPAGKFELEPRDTVCVRPSGVGTPRAECAVVAQTLPDVLRSVKCRGREDQ